MRNQRGGRLRSFVTVRSSACVCGWEFRGHGRRPPTPSGHPPGSQARGRDTCRDALRTLFRAAPALGMAVVRRDHLLFAPQVHNQGLATSVSIMVKPMGQKGRVLPSQVAGGGGTPACPRSSHPHTQAEPRTAGREFWRVSQGRAWRVTNRGDFALHRFAIVVAVRERADTSMGERPRRQSAQRTTPLLEGRSLRGD